MIKYWNNQEGINWLDFKKEKNHYWGCSLQTKHQVVFFEGSEEYF